MDILDKTWHSRTDRATVFGKCLANDMSRTSSVYINMRIRAFMRIREWTKKYGPYFGITEGVSQTLVISDVEMINEIFLKQFDNFYGRKLNGIMGDPNKEKRVHLFASEGYRWKRLRNLSSPTFSNNSLKKIKETVEDSALELLKHIEKNTSNGESIDMLTFYQEFTMDVISRIAMGQHQTQMFSNPLLEPVKAIFGSGRRWLILIGMIFPKWAAYIVKRIIFSLPTGTPAVKIHTTVEKALNKRIAQREDDAAKGIEPGEPADFIDLFLDARAEIDVTAENSNEFIKTSGKSISFEQLSKLKYLDHVIKEALRLYPLGSIANTRRCMKTTKIGDLLIEKGTNIQVDTWTLHYDKKLWGEDAEEFRPERWDEPGVTDFKSGYMPFGLGPRQCIGMRLAYMEEKLLLAHILRNYDFVTGKKTQIPLKLVGNSTTQPENVFLHLKSRY